MITGLVSGRGKSLDLGPETSSFELLFGQSSRGRTYLFQLVGQVVPLPGDCVTIALGLLQLPTQLLDARAGLPRLALIPLYLRGGVVRGLG